MCQMATLAMSASVISRKELIELREAEDDLRIALARLTAAESAVKPLRLAIAEKVLGVKTWDDWKVR